MTPARGRSRPVRRPWAAADRSYVEFVLDQLSGLGGVESRAMFGGYGLYKAGTFFAILWRGRLYFLTDDATRPAFEARGMKPFRPSPGQTLGSYYEVPAEVVEDPAEAVRWGRAAVAAQSSRQARR